MGCNTLTNPYYVHACGIQEPQTLNVYNYFFSNIILTAEDWVVPACGEYAVIKLGNSAVIPTGEYIYHPLYGHFKVVSYNQETCILTITNECQFGNASPGYHIPKCTSFLLTTSYCFCEEPAIDTGSLNVCNEGTVATLSGASTGLVPVLVDVDTEYVEFLDPNDAYAMRCCDWDLSARVLTFNEEYEYTDSFDLYDIPFPYSTVYYDIEVENDTCRDLYLFLAASMHINGDFHSVAGGYLNWEEVLHVYVAPPISVSVLYAEKREEQPCNRTATIPKAHKLTAYGVATIPAYNTYTFVFSGNLNIKGAGGLNPGFILYDADRKLRVNFFGIAI